MEYPPFARLMMIPAVKNVEASVLADDKPVAKEFGELQFIRGGIAGPICLTMSRKVARLQHFNQCELELSIDLKPALSEDKLDARIMRDIQEFSKSTLAEIVRKLLPGPLVAPILDAAFLEAQIVPGDPEKQVTVLVIEIGADARHEFDHNFVPPKL